MSKASQHVWAILNSRGEKLSRDSTFRPSEIASIASALDEDSSLFFGSAIICFVNAIAGLEKHRTTWPIVQLYYSVYFCLNSILASEKTAIVRRGKSPFQISLNPYRVLTIKKSAHDALIKVFQQVFPGHFLISQDIEGESSLVWMKALREKFNYQTPGFIEPNVPDCLEYFYEHGSRRLLSAYFERPEHLAFDPDHAVISFPVLCLKTTCDVVKCASVEKLDYCKRVAVDSKGPIPEIERFLLSCKDE